MGNFAAGCIKPAPKTVGLERAIYDCPKFGPVIQDKKTTSQGRCQQVSLIYYYHSAAALDRLDEGGSESADPAGMFLHATRLQGSSGQSPDGPGQASRLPHSILQ